MSFALVKTTRNFPYHKWLRNDIPNPPSNNVTTKQAKEPAAKQRPNFHLKLYVQPHFTSSPDALSHHPRPSRPTGGAPRSPSRDVNARSDSTPEILALNVQPWFPPAAIDPVDATPFWPQWDWDEELGWSILLKASTTTTLESMLSIDRSFCNGRGIAACSRLLEEPEIVNHVLGCGGFQIFIQQMLTQLC